MAQRTNQRSTALAAVLLAVAAGLIWASSRMTWVNALAIDGLGEDRELSVDGGTWAAATTPLALVLLAAIAATFAVKGWVVRVVALLVALVAIAAAMPALSLLVGGASGDQVALVAEVPGRAEVLGVTTSPLGPVLVIVGAFAALAAAVALARRPRTAGGLSAKYDAPAARRAATVNPAAAGAQEPVTQRMMWDALDVGEDPTADDVGDGLGPGRGNTQSAD